MKLSISRLSLAFVLVCFGIAGCAGSSEPIMSLEKFSGQVKIKPKHNGTLSPAVADQKLFDNGEVLSEDESTAVLRLLKDETRIELSENTHFTIKNFSQKELSQLSGVAVYQVSPQNTELKIQTPHGIATVLGTIFRLDINATCTVLIVEEGKVGFVDKKHSVVVGAGNRYISELDNSPQAVDPDLLNKLFSDETRTKSYFNLR